MGRKGRDMKRRRVVTADTAPAAAPQVVVVAGVPIAKPVVKLNAREKADEAVRHSTAQPLPESNKGFALLAKMGYKKGQGLGRKEEGRVEPIELDIRRGRAGIGVERPVEVRRKAAEDAFQAAIVAARKREAALTSLRADFRTSMSQRYERRAVEARVRQACRHAAELDGRIGEAAWVKFWTSHGDEKEEEEEKPRDAGDEDSSGSGSGGGGGGADDDNATTVVPDARLEAVKAQWVTAAEEERLLLVLHHLRCRHVYCLFCGTAFDDEEDMNKHCPGLTFEDH